MPLSFRHRLMSEKSGRTGSNDTLMAIWQRARTLAAGLPDYTIRADRQTHAANRGIHGRRRAGPGDSFWQYRPYQAGEEAHVIDWRRSARSDMLYVRQQEWETARNVWFWIDTSPSMHFRYGKSGDNKLDRARLLALATACLLTGAGERVALYGSHQRAAGGHYGLDRLLAAMITCGEPETPPIPEAPDLPQHSRLILIGDFLGDEDDIRHRLARLVSHGIDGHMHQILDPAEMDFPYKGHVRFEGLERENPISLNRAEDLATSYRRRMAEWTKTIGDTARRVGWTHSLHRTDHSPALALLDMMTLTGQSL